MLTPAFGQGRGSAPSSQETPPEIHQRYQEIQKVIERSSEQLKQGDQQFENRNYEQARRTYDKAVDLILEAGLDVTKDPRLQKHYQAVVDHVFQRQMAVHTAAQGTPSPEVAQQAPPAAHVFGQQDYEVSPLDELANLKLTDDELNQTNISDVKSAVAAARLDFEFKPNALIQGFINFYLNRGRSTMETGLRRSGRFMQMARKIFKEEGVPQDLVWLGQVESAWSPIARSWASAVGLWQFVPGTGMQYGLRQDYWVDERSSFEKSTRASARYLKWLANRYAGNWELAMAAYNSGEGRVDRAIAVSGYADFWEIYTRGLLPNETRNYVPNILATIMIAKNPERYGFSVKPEPALAYDLVTVTNSVDLRLVADATDTTYDFLQALNPELKRGVTPPGLPHALRIPAGRGKTLQLALSRIPPDKRTVWRFQTATSEDTFETIARRTGVSEDTLAAVNGGVLKPGQKVIIPTGSPVRTVAAVAPKGALMANTARTSKIVNYKVQSGENLGDIAARYGISVRDITALNRLGSSAKLRAGQVLKVPVKSTK
jgi:membrane-bound lytic murein transglycosylase D